MPMFRIAVFILIGFSFCFGSRSAAAAEPLQVYILAGQSNMQGHAEVRTFDHIGMDPKTAPILAEMRSADGTPRVLEQVWISSLGSASEVRTGNLTAGFGAEGRGPKIGPEFTFGIYMHKLVNKPILIIKTAWGGKSIHTDFRPPSAGPYVFNDQQIEAMEKRGEDIDAAKAERAKATGHYYRLMLTHIQSVLKDIQQVVPNYDASAGYELSGFVWFQGWNDMVDRGVYPDRDKPGGYDAYSEVLAHFIRDVRRDLNAPRLPFVIGVMGVGGPVEKYLPSEKRYAAVHTNFRNAMAAPAALKEFKGNVVAVRTEKYWDVQLTALEAKWNERNAKAKAIEQDATLTAEQRKQAIDTATSELFTEEELKILQTGKSNAAYHYLGSSKILAQIGKAFAEAVYGLDN